MLEQYTATNSAEYLALGTGEACAAATCGELAQGFLNRRDFLINLPIAFYARVRVARTLSGIVRVVTGGYYRKVEQAVAATLLACGKATSGADVEVYSSIPHGKGMASSTAELVAAIKATAQACAAAFSDEDITRILLAIDRSTDSVHLPGISMCDHLNGDIFELFGAPPPLALVVVDTGGKVETANFDREMARDVARCHADELSLAVALIRNGIRTRSGASVAEGATISARVNQKVLHKPCLEELILATKPVGGLGVACAHTGTVLGVMFDPRETFAESIIQRIDSVFGRSGVIVGVFDLVGGA